MDHLSMPLRDGNGINRRAFVSLIIETKPFFVPSWVTNLGVAKRSHYWCKKFPKFHVRELVFGESKLSDEVGCSGNGLSSWKSFGSVLIVYPIPDCILLFVELGHVYRLYGCFSMSWRIDKQCSGPNQLLWNNPRDTIRDFSDIILLVQPESEVTKIVALHFIWLFVIRLRFQYIGETIARACLILEVGWASLKNVTYFVETWSKESAYQFWVETETRTRRKKNIDVI